MMCSWTLLLCLLCTGLVSSIHHYRRSRISSQDGGDAGEPLFLTPYVERGDVAEGRRRARVTLTEDLNIESYAGFFTVNKTYDSSQFLWYFPPLNATSDAPVVLWLQGGPGDSSLYGLFAENGPLKVTNKKMERRKINWALDHHLIYIDNPVGTGFSFTNDPKGYCEHEVEVGEQVYSSITQFFKLFPDLQTNKFFITGESYAGKYVTALAYTIHEKNPAAELKLNLKGIAIGNGWIDPEHQMVHWRYLNQVGLLDWNQGKVFEQYENKAVEYIKQKNWLAAFDIYGTLLNGGLIPNGSLLYNMTGFDFYCNILHTKDYTDPDDYAVLLQQSAVRKAIHVGEMPYNDGTIVMERLKQDMMQSVTPWLKKLLDHYKVLIYNGQLDILVPYPMTVNFLRNLNFTGAEEYKTAKRQIWKVDGEVAGYAKGAGRLVEVLVRNAGHMVPADQPKWALDLIKHLTYASNFYPSAF